MAEKLTVSERRKALAALEGWSEVEGRDAIQRRFWFEDFTAAFAFMARCALTAERMDHHPEWFNVYNRVEVILATHSADGVTELDIRLAVLMNGAAKATGCMEDSSPA